jgi:hypothetical protein
MWNQNKNSQGGQRAIVEWNVENVQENDENSQGGGRRRIKRKEVNGEQARSLFDSLLAMSRNGKLKGHETSEVAAMYSVHARTIQRSWNRGKLA